MNERRGKMTQPADIYLITGGTGAGKTTYAISMAKALSGVRFSIDEWMTNLFWMDSPDPIEHEWALERIARSETQIWETVLQLAAQNVPAILDLGFTKANHRGKFATLAEEHGLGAALVYVDIDAEERWSRVTLRNEQRGETFAMDVTRDQFEFMESIWEPPTHEEMNRLQGIRIDADLVGVQPQHTQGDDHDH